MNKHWVLALKDRAERVEIVESWLPGRFDVYDVEEAFGTKKMQHMLCTPDRVFELISAK